MGPEGGRERHGAGPIELLGHQTSIPIEDGVGLGNARDILQGFASQSFRDLG
jgi:hypothetical protein